MLSVSAPEQVGTADGGYAASINRLSPISPEWFQIEDGKLILQHNKKAFDLFNKDLKGNTVKADQNWPGLLAKNGVYGGKTDPLPMMDMFDRQLQLRMGQCNVRRWIDDILPLLVDDDPLGVDALATHRLSLDQAPDAYSMFQKKLDGTVKVLFHP